ncbi:MAG: SMP-30/gluconolactonase/LRE family protein [Chloroflexi bacterium]|nr:SMP-30/gluconolactonase/LRE family protein [Chloroflexota bacterium]
MTWEFELVAGPDGNRADGPAWDGEALLFTTVSVPSNTIHNKILRYDPGTGEVSDYRRWTNRVVGLTFAADGTLYGCQSGARRILRYNGDGSASVMAYKVDGKYHNQPKDLAIDSKGRIWFADPVWGPPVVGGLRDYELAPYSIDYRAVLRIESPNRDAPLTRMTFDTTTPLDVALSREEDVLYVAESSEEPEGRRELRAYPINADGYLGDYKVLHSFGADYRGIHRGISGMCLDTEGNIIACAGWAQSGPGSMIYVFSPAGQVLETHPVPAEPTNCAFGGPGLSDLYVTSSEGHLFRVGNTGRQGWMLYPKAA